MHVLTSENAQEFYAQKLGFDKLEEQAQKVEAALKGEEEPDLEKDVDDEKEVTQESAPKSKKNGKIETRFKELTDRNKNAQAAREAAEARAEAAEAKARELEAKLNPPKPEKKGKPQANQFTDIADYTEALASWRVEEILSEREAKAAADKAKKEREQTISAFNKRMQEAEARIPGMRDLISSATDLQVSNVISEAIVESEFAPEILNFLAGNEDFVEKLNGMSHEKALRAFGKLEARFEKEASAEEVDDEPEDEIEHEKAVVKPKPKAPPPISPLKKGKNSDDPINSPGEFSGSYAQYKAARMANRF